MTSAAAPDTSAAVHCPVCVGSQWDLHLDQGAYRYVRCPSCGLVRLDPFPSAGQARALYDDDYFTASANSGYDNYVADAAIHRRNGRARLGRVGPPPTPDSRFVDIGCAHGFTMIEARSAGWEPWGVDANATARQAVRELGMRCESSYEALDLPERSVAAVGFFQVLEHLPDPVAALEWAASVIKPDGRVVIETWNRSSLVARLMGRRWQAAAPPSVLWLFDRPALTRMAARSGLRLVSFRRTMKWVTVGLVVGQIRDRAGGEGPLRLASRIRAVPLPYALGDLVTVTLGVDPDNTGG